MNRAIFTASFLAWPVWAQTSAISGIVTAPNGAALAKAPVQAQNTATKSNYRALTSADGRYSLSKLPAGSYLVSVTMPGFSFEPFRRPDVPLANGQSLTLDIRLAQGTSLDTLGDDPASYLSSIRGKAPPSGKTPRLANGKPDLSGVWHGNDDLFPEDPPMLPWVAERFQKLLESNIADTPGLHCLPQGPLFVGAFFFKLVHTPKLLLMIQEDIPNLYQVYLDGRAHPVNLDPSWMGHSIGKWDGDTLVVDRVGFNDRSLIGITSHSEQLHITERWKRTGLGHMKVEVTIDDPGAYTKPWKINMDWVLAPGDDVLEYVCENNKDAQHMVGK